VAGQSLDADANVHEAFPCPRKLGIEPIIIPGKAGKGMNNTLCQLGSPAFAFWAAGAGCEGSRSGGPGRRWCCFLGLRSHSGGTFER